MFPVDMCSDFNLLCQLRRSHFQYELGESLEDGFIAPLRVSLTEARKTRCGQEFLKQLAPWQEVARLADHAAANETQTVL